MCAGAASCAAPLSDATNRSSTPAAVPTEQTKDADGEKRTSRKREAREIVLSHHLFHLSMPLEAFFLLVRRLREVDAELYQVASRYIGSLTKKDKMMGLDDPVDKTSAVPITNRCLQAIGNLVTVSTKHRARPFPFSPLQQPSLVLLLFVAGLVTFISGRVFTSNGCTPVSPASGSGVHARQLSSFPLRQWNTKALWSV